MLVPETASAGKGGSTQLQSNSFQISSFGKSHRPWDGGCLALSIFQISNTELTNHFNCMLGNRWNSLPQPAVMVPCLDAFQSGLDTFMKEKSITDHDENMQLHFEK